MADEADPDSVLAVKNVGSRTAYRPAPRRATRKLGVLRYNGQQEGGAWNAPRTGYRGKGQQEGIAPCTGYRGRGQEPFSEQAIMYDKALWPKKVPDPAHLMAARRGMKKVPDPTLLSATIHSPSRNPNSAIRI